MKHNRKDTRLYNDVRFRFGKNWRSFFSILDERHIKKAEDTLKSFLELDSFAGKKFLDIGSGSGLFSLAARRLGADVMSFDFDQDSVACTKELKKRYSPDDGHWKIEQGSVLDVKYMESLGVFDIVYSWGVLHHTGDLSTALGNAIIPLKEKGCFYTAIYNDQGFASKVWLKVKRFYNLNIFYRLLITAFYFPYFTLQSVIIGLIKYRNPFGHFIYYRQKRGMSIYHDWIDWLGGYPFEVAKPSAIFKFYRKRGLILNNITLTRGIGCNEFLFTEDSKCASSCD